MQSEPLRARKLLGIFLAELLGAAVSAGPVICGFNAHNDPARQVSPLSGTPALGAAANPPQSLAQPAALEPGITLPQPILPDAAPASAVAPTASPDPQEIDTPSALDATKTAAPEPASPGKDIPAVEGGPVRDAPAGSTPQFQRQPPISGSAMPGSAAKLDSGRLFDGNSSPSKGPDGLAINDDGVPVWDRAAEYYGEVRRMANLLRARGVDLRESLDVMDDAYSLAWAKLKALEHLSRGHAITDYNIHLPMTLQWIDATLREPTGLHKALLTHQVFFHHADNPRSEIEEGMRRVDSYLREIRRHFNKRKGKNQEFDQVILAFDTRGYQEIKSHIQKSAKDFGPRFKFMYLDDFAAVPQDAPRMRQALTDIIRRHKGPQFRDVAEGVIYSRYVGLLLELKTLEYFTDRGYTILQSGHEIFDENGQYKTELDAVVQSPKGEVSVVEAKSTRVPLTPEYVLQNKFLYKLAAYKKDRSLLEKAIGHTFNTVAFTVDVGKNQKLIGLLNQKAEELSKEYGFDIRFIFIESHPLDEKGRQPRRHRGRRKRRR